MLHAGAGVPLAPHFQGRSAAAHHSSGAVPLTDERLGAGVPDARRDVDTEVDLLGAVGLGLGPATAALVDPATGRARDVRGRHDDRPGRRRRSGGHAGGVRVALAEDRLADDLRSPRPGQRLHAVLAGTTVLSAWSEPPGWLDGPLSRLRRRRRPRP